MEKRNKIKLSVLIITALITLFWSTYCVSSILYSGIDDDYKNEAVNNNIEEGIYLDDNITINLYPKNSEKDEVKTLKEVKEEYNMSGKVSEEELTVVLKKNGYELDNEVNVDNELTYKQKLLPNKYYIKEYNGYLAIYKCDDECNLTIEDEDSDVYTEAIKYNQFSDTDKKYFEENNAEYATKEEAENYITQFIS